MFGYVVAPLQGLTPEQAQRYRAVYCGLCRALGQRHGQKARFALTYDMTFLTLLLQSLYEPEERTGAGRCAPHPVRPRAWAASDVTDYAADMTIALTWHKCMDDWQDDHDLKAKAYADLLRGSYDRVRELWPRQCGHIEQCMLQYAQLEKENAPGSALCDCFGRLMRELFVWREDAWSSALRSLGSSLGAFICMMDGAMDMEKDGKKGAYNVLASMELTPESARPMLTVLAGRVTDIFERLPLVQDLELLRSILYAGIWQRYDAVMNKQNEAERKDGPPDGEANSPSGQGDQT